MADEDIVERLRIVLEADFSKLVKDTVIGVKQAETELKKVETAGEKIKASFARIGESVKSFMSGKLFQPLTQGAKESTKGIETLEQKLKKLGVAYDANVQRFRKGGKFIRPEELEQLKKQFPEISHLGKSAFDDTSKASMGFGSILTGFVAGSVAAVTAALLDMAKQGIMAMVDLAKKAISLNSELEQAKITFTSMFQGNEQAANAFIEHLKEQSKLLKISQSEAQQFAKSILPDTNSVKQFDEVLRLATVGAKDAKKNVSDLIFTFNEAVSGDFTSMRDILDLPPDVLGRLRASKGDVSVLIDELNKLFTKRGVNDIGAFSSTLDTTTANLRSFAEELLLIASQPGFESLNESAQALFDVLQDKRPELELIAGAIGDIVANVVDFAGGNLVDFLESLDTEEILEFTQTFFGLVDQAQILVDIIAELAFPDTWISDLTTTVELLQDVVRGAIEVTLLAKAEAARQKAIQEDAGFTPEQFGGGIQGNIMATGAAIGKSLASGPEEIERSRKVGQEAFNQVMAEGNRLLEESNQRIEENRQKTEDRRKEQEKSKDTDTSAIDAILELSNAESEQAKVTKILTDNLEKYGSELIELQEQTNEKIEELETEHDDEMIEITAEYIARRLKESMKLSKDLTKLEQDSIDERGGIIAEAREELADLSSSTDDEIKKRREEFNQQEQTEEEDHLLEMRRLRDRYLLNLEDAVKSRDARAIVDLRRQYELEKSQKEQDFQTDDAREQTAFEDEINTLREQEQLKADEIEKALQEELAQNIANEEEKRAALQASYDEQIIQLNEAEQAKKDAEQAKYDERKDALETAMAERLEAIAKALAEEDTINEEGAQKILETLAKFFGEEGEIEKLMAAYRDRLNTQMDIEVSFGSGETTTNSGTRSSRGSLNRSNTAGGTGPSFGDGGSMIADKPSVALFGEKGKELAIFIPMSQLSGASIDQAKQDNLASSLGGSSQIDVNLRISGSAPPGVGKGEVDQIAGILVNAFNEAGIRVK